MRLTVDSGVLATTQVIRDPHLIEMATRVARRIDAAYATNVAFRQDGAGHLKLVRVKPRFRASKSGNGGANLPLLSLRALLEDTAPRGKPGGGGQYTKFMLSHEKSVTHSQMIIGGLMETLMKQIDHPLKIVELEGDALFLYSPKTSDSSLWDSRSHRLMKSLLRLFDIFRHRRAELAAYSVCRCEACANLGELKLKVVAHSGEALLNQVGDFSVLSGVDVITVHRLLKNSVDGNRYMLMTESAYRDLQPPDGFEVEEGVEEYDIGTLNTFVHFPTIPEDETMDIHGNFSDDNVAVKILRHEIQKEYTQVACEPNRGYHFNTGRVAAEMTEYRMEWLEGIPEHVVESFAGTGNPFSLGEIQPGEHVVDVGSGAGLDTMIAGGMVGGDGHVIGVDMTEAMIQKAKTGAQEARLPQVEFREGFAEALPVPDDWGRRGDLERSRQLVPREVAGAQRNATRASSRWANTDCGYHRGETGSGGGEAKHRPLDQLNRGGSAGGRAPGHGRGRGVREIRSDLAEERVRGSASTVQGRRGVRDSGGELQGVQAGKLTAADGRSDGSTRSLGRGCRRS